MLCKVLKRHSTATIAETTGVIIRCQVAFVASRGYIFAARRPWES
jgi:hypothetical protein